MTSQRQVCAGSDSRRSRVSALMSPASGASTSLPHRDKSSTLSVWAACRVVPDTSRVSRVPDTLRVASWWADANRSRCSTVSGLSDRSSVRSCVNDRRVPTRIVLSLFAAKRSTYNKQNRSPRRFACTHYSTFSRRWHTNLLGIDFYSVTKQLGIKGRVRPV